MKKTYILGLAAALSGLAFLPTEAAADAGHKTWTDPETAKMEDPDFSIQGEYGSAEAGAKWAAQVVALGDGKFEAYLLQDGLPGLGWTREKSRTLLKGERERKHPTGAVIGGAALAVLNEELKNLEITLENTDKSITAKISKGELTLKTADGKTETLPRIERKSPTLDAKPPSGAVVLFDGTSAEQWEKGKIEGGHLLATGCSSKQQFGDYKLHLEFRTPYKPAARGQQRGNSGIYHSGRWETQILDSFGLEGLENECGGIYSVSKPRLNMCLPPLAWQTYDVDFTAAKFDASGKRTAWPRITVRLNGELVHDDLELPKDFTTAAPISTPLVNPEGPVFLQDHGNPVVFRNIWIVPGK